MARKITPQDEDAPLDEKRHKFVHWFRKYRDLYKAAERAGVPKNKAVATWCEPAVQEEFDRQEEAVRTERARQEVTDEKLTNELLDRELLATVRVDALKHGTLKLEALRLAYVRTGTIQSGNSKPLDLPGGEDGDGRQSRVYSAYVQLEEKPAPLLPAEPEASGQKAVVSSQPAPPASGAAAPPAPDPPPARPAHLPKAEKRPAPGGGPKTPAGTVKLL